jgi:hypothetical protein
VADNDLHKNGYFFSLHLQCRTLARVLECDRFAAFVENEMGYVWRAEELKAKLIEKVLDKNSLLKNFLLEWTFPFRSGSQKAKVIFEVIAENAKYRGLVSRHIEAHPNDDENFLRKSCQDPYCVQHS